MAAWKVPFLKQIIHPIQREPDPIQQNSYLLPPADVITHFQNNTDYNSVSKFCKSWRSQIETSKEEYFPLSATELVSAISQMNVESRLSKAQLNALQPNGYEKSRVCSQFPKFPISQIPKFPISHITEWNQKGNEQDQLANDGSHCQNQTRKNIWKCMKSIFFVYYPSHLVTYQPIDCIGMEIIYYHKNRARDGKIINYDANKSHGKHLIILYASNEFHGESLWISLKSKFDKKQLELIDRKEKLTNIMRFTDYLKLYISETSPRHKILRPTYFNDKQKKWTNKKHRNILDYHSSKKANRWDWKLTQKYAFGKNENCCFMQMMIGVCYETKNRGLICVQDIITTNGTQVIKYFKVLKLS